MKKKILCTALATVMLMSQTVSAAPPWRVNQNQIVFDNELGIKGFVTLRFATETGRVAT